MRQIPFIQYNTWRGLNEHTSHISFHCRECRWLHLDVSTAVTTGSSQLLHSSPHSEHLCWVSVAAREALTEFRFLHELLISEWAQSLRDEAKNCFPYQHQECDPLSACPPDTMSCKSGDCCQESTLLPNLYSVLERWVMVVETVLGQTAVACQDLLYDPWCCLCLQGWSHGVCGAHDAHRPLQLFYSQDNISFFSPCKRPAILFGQYS